MEAEKKPTPNLEDSTGLSIWRPVTRISDAELDGSNSLKKKKKNLKEAKSLEYKEAMEYVTVLPNTSQPHKYCENSPKVLNFKRPPIRPTKSSTCYFSRMQ